MVHNTILKNSQTHRVGYSWDRTIDTDRAAESKDYQLQCDMSKAESEGGIGTAWWLVALFPETNPLGLDSNGRRSTTAGVGLKETSSTG